MKKNVNSTQSNKATTVKAPEKPSVEIVKTNQTPAKSKEPKIEDILGYGDKVVTAKKRIKWFDDKLEDLSAFQESYQRYLDNSPDEIISDNTQDKFDFKLTFTHKTPSNYGKGEELIEIANPHVLNAFVAELTEHINSKRDEAIAQLKQLDKEYAKRFIRQ